LVTLLALGGFMLVMFRHDAKQPAIEAKESSPIEGGPTGTKGNG
jgi:hypothetical protein